MMIYTHATALSIPSTFGIRQADPGRRNQSCARQSEKCAARSDAGTPSHARQRNPTDCPIRSWSWRRKIPSNKKEPIRCPKRRLTASFKVVGNYPNRAQERAILDAMATRDPNLAVEPVVSVEDIAQARRVVNAIYIDDKVKNYIVDLVLATRDPRPYASTERLRGVRRLAARDHSLPSWPARGPSSKATLRHAAGCEDICLDVFAPSRDRELRS